VAVGYKELIMFGKIIKNVTIPGYGGVSVFELPETIMIIEDGVEREVPTEELRRLFPGLLTFPSPYSGPYRGPCSMSHRLDSSDNLIEGHCEKSEGSNDATIDQRSVSRSATENSRIERSIDVKEAADILGCSTRTVHALCTRGQLSFHWVGNKRGFRPDDLKDYWGQGRIAPKKRTGPRKSVDDLDGDAVRCALRTTLDKKKGGQTSEGAPITEISSEVSKASRLRKLRAEMRKW
jgi:excisionase family DNA binding protein